MKRFLSILLSIVVFITLVTVGAALPVTAANGTDFLRQSTLSCVGASAQFQGGILTVKATAADQEIALVADEAANLTSYPYWEGIVQSDVPFDIVFYDKTYNKWIYASANFCYEFEGNNGASEPLPAGRHEEAFKITGAYTFNGDALPTDAAIRSIIFILRAPGTLKVERCAMTDGKTFSRAYPDVVYQMDSTMITAIPVGTTVQVFCDNARLQFDTVKTSVEKKNNVAAYIGTGDVVTLFDGKQSASYTAVVRGDMDASGTISTSDVRALLKYCIDPSVFDATQQVAADVLTDGKVNTNDGRLLLLSTLTAPSMQFAQEQVVANETYLTETKYETFLDASVRDTMVAGLNKNLVPQGLAQSHKNGLLYMSAYASDGGNSAVLVYDADGQFCAEYILYNADSTPCKNHLGGVAVTDTTLFLSYDSDNTYRVAAIPLTSLVTKGTQKVVINTFYEVPVATSFLSFYDGWLWMGNFYLPSGGYDLMRTLNYTTEGYGCYIAGYDLSTLGNDRLVPASGQSYPTPDVLMAAPQKVQGMMFDTKTNTVILSHSWGRKNDSSLAFYTVNLSGKADTTITLNDTAVKCFVLASSVKQVKAIPMAEGITSDGNGGVKVLFESGANKYSDGLHRTDYIWRFVY
ncbi:MAG: hypothetical protein E7553_05060 [Ruminococcaceae bacterium]|nr:hypothetical protein [Oscillospiraceae bacterium]